MDRAAATTSSSSTPSQKRKILNNKRPDSMKLELLTIPENVCLQSFPTSSGSNSNNNSVGFKNLSYSVREGLLRRREFFNFIYLFNN